MRTEQTDAKGPSRAVRTEQTDAKGPSRAVQAVQMDEQGPTIQEQVCSAASQERVLPSWSPEPSERSPAHRLAVDGGRCARERRPSAPEYVLLAEGLAAHSRPVAFRSGPVQPVGVPQACSPQAGLVWAVLLSAAFLPEAVRLEVPGEHWISAGYSALAG